MSTLSPTCTFPELIMPPREKPEVMLLNTSVTLSLRGLSRAGRTAGLNLSAIDTKIVITDDVTLLWCDVRCQVLLNTKLINMIISYQLEPYNRENIVVNNKKKWLVLILLLLLLLLLSSQNPICKQTYLLDKCGSPVPGKLRFVRRFREVLTSQSTAGNVNHVRVLKTGLLEKASQFADNFFEPFLRPIDFIHFADGDQ